MSDSLDKGVGTYVSRSDAFEPRPEGQYVSAETVQIGPRGGYISDVDHDQVVGQYVTISSSQITGGIEATGGTEAWSNEISGTFAWVVSPPL